MGVGTPEAGREERSEEGAGGAGGGACFDDAEGAAAEGETEAAAAGVGLRRGRGARRWFGEGLGAPPCCSHGRCHGWASLLMNSSFGCSSVHKKEVSFTRAETREEEGDAPKSPRPPRTQSLSPS